MKQPRLVIATLYYEDHSRIVVGNVVRVDHGRVVGTDRQTVTIEISDARLCPKKRRRKTAATSTPTDPQATAARMRVANYIPRIRP